MEIPSKQELQQIAFTHSLYIHFQDFVNLYKKCTAKPYSYLVIDSTLPSDNPLHFRKESFGKNIRLEMKNCNMILTGK